MLHFTLDTYLIFSECYARRYQVPFLEYWVWRDLRWNPGFLDNWRKLYPLGERAGVINNVYFPKQAEENMEWLKDNDEWTDGVIFIPRTNASKYYICRNMSRTHSNSIYQKGKRTIPNISINISSIFPLIIYCWKREEKFGALFFLLVCVFFKNGYCLLFTIYQCLIHNEYFVSHVHENLVANVILRKTISSKNF